MQRQPEKTVNQAYAKIKSPTESFDTSIKKGWLLILFSFNLTL